MAQPKTAWFDQNRDALLAAATVARVEIQIAQAGEVATKVKREHAKLLQQTRAAEEKAGAAVKGGSGLDRVAVAFGLSPFERRTLAAAAAVVLDPAFATLVTATGRPALDFGVALRSFAEPHWTATLPSHPLRYWRLLEPAASGHLLSAPLVLDERVLHFLLGIDETDPRVGSVARRLAANVPLAAGQGALAEEIASCWLGATAEEICPTVQLQGGTRAESRAVVAAAAEGFDSEAWVVDASLIAGLDVQGWRRLWEREAVLRGAVLVIESEAHDPVAPEAQRLAELVRGPVVLAGGRWPAGARPRRLFEVPAPTPEDRIEWWTAAVGKASANLEPVIAKAALQFRLPTGAALEAGRRLALGGPATEQSFWSECRRAGRSDLDHLAERIEARASRKDLILPATQREVLRDLAAAARQQHTVGEKWGFAEKSARGLGLTALFAGPSGTGKTMAAEVLAGELDLDLYRIDLSAVVSKYIGETEKNLRRVFDAADQSGALLLFDEADALFGKRSEVRDSHDRYANIEIGYLLQRMETYRGLAILTTNLRQSLDEAFLRRLRFVVNFPFPDAAARAEIWERVLPAQTPRGKLDWRRLAQLNIAGGNIRNIALGAAVLAAEDGGAVEMRHLSRAARAECMKLERVLAESELAGWV